MKKDCLDDLDKLSLAKTAEEKEALWRKVLKDINLTKEEMDILMGRSQ